MKALRYLSLLPLTVLLASALNAVELRFLNWDGTEDTLKYANKNKTVTIRADEGSFSPAYQFEGAGPLVLFKETVVDGKTVRETAATLTVPAGLTHAIIVLAATDEAKKVYAGVWIDDSPVTRPAGTIRTVNLSRRQVAFKMDTSEFALEPSGNHQITVNQNVRRIVTLTAANVDGRWETVSHNPMAVRSGLRLLVLLRDGRPQEGAKTNVVDMLSFYDVPPPLPKETGTKVANSSR